MSSLEGLGSTNGAQVIPPPREMQVPSEADRVPQTGHLGEQGRDGPRESRWSPQLAYPGELD